MEKSLPFPEVVQDQSTRLRKRDVITTSWAAAATALFLMTLIGGYIYMANMRADCQHQHDQGQFPDQQHQTKTYQADLVENGQREIENVYLDADQMTQLIIKKDNDDGSIILIAGIDYNKKISVCYMAEWDECLLVAGDGLDWFDAWNTPNNQTVTLDEKTRYYKADTSNVVSDLSLLPSEMRPFCQGKHMYWAYAEGLVSDAGRDKRGSCSFGCWRCQCCGTCCGVRCRF